MRNEYLATENRILRDQLKGRLRLTDGERITLAEIGQRLGRKALAEVETLKSLRNRVSKEIGALMGQKKLAEAEAKKAETKDLGEQIAALRVRLAAAGIAVSMTATLRVFDGQPGFTYDY